jgi:hypothetical protein
MIACIALLKNLALSLSAAIAVVGLLKLPGFSGSCLLTVSSPSSALDSGMWQIPPHCYIRVWVDSWGNFEGYAAAWTQLKAEAPLDVRKGRSDGAA